MMPDGNSRNGFVVKAADNATNLYGVMWKPSDFNPE